MAKVGPVTNTNAEYKVDPFNYGTRPETPHPIRRKILIALACISIIGIIFYLLYSAWIKKLNKYILSEFGNKRPEREREFEVYTHDMAKELGFERTDFDISMNSGHIRGVSFKHNDGKKHKTIIICNNSVSIYYENMSEFTMASFYTRNFDVIVFDYRGTGESSGSKFSSTTLVEDCEAVCAYAINKLGLKESELSLYGHCLGGAVAIQAAQHHPGMSLVADRTFISWNAAAKRKVKYNFGIIGKLLSPLLSCVKMNFENEKTLRKLKNSKIVVISGKKDRFLGETQLQGLLEVPLSHCDLLSNKEFDAVSLLLNNDENLPLRTLVS